MEDIRKQTWAKLVALVLAIISGFVLVVTGAATVAFGTVPEMQLKQSEMENELQKQLLTGYGNYLIQDTGILDKEDDEKGKVTWDGLDGGNIRYSVLREVTGTGESTVLYTNDATVTQDSAQTVVSVPMTGYSSYTMKQVTMWSLLSGYANRNWYWENSWRSRKIDGIVYNKEDGLFYGKGATGNYYLMSSFVRYADNAANGAEAADSTETAASITETDGVYYALDVLTTDGSAYYEYGDNQKLDEEKINAWIKQNDLFAFNDYNCTFTEDAASYPTIECVDSIPSDRKLVVGEYSLMDDGSIEYDASTLQGENICNYLICLSAKDPLGNTSMLKSDVKDYMNDVHTLAARICSFRKISGLWVALSAIICVAGFVFLMQAAGRRKKDDEIHLTWLDKIPYGIMLIGIGMAAVGCICGAVLCVEAWYNMYITLGLGLAALLLFLFAAEGLTILAFTSTAVRVKSGKFWHYTFCHQMCRPFHWLIQQIRENTKLSIRVGVAIGALTFVELIVIAATDYDSGTEMMLFFLYKCFEIPFVFSIAFQIRKLIDGGRRMVRGDYSQPIDTKHMKGIFKEHADNLNNLGQGISRAVDEQMKSERFKTELITNVSHDIKTPLTSIINYVDLMEKEEIDNPKVQEYLEVLDRQSARLKKLIEDLMEASKASTGNIKVDLERCDATVMLTQVVGEFEDRAKKNDLDIVVSSPEPPANIMADGRHLWRVIDNLMSNICKYAQPGTRVYIDLEKYNGMIIMTFRNTSRYQLNISSEELMERFVRGDSSRNTEGSGLGLSIAQSLTALMGGNFAIQIDGDLFKAILSFDECE